MVWRMLNGKSFFNPNRSIRNVNFIQVTDEIGAFTELRPGYVDRQLCIYLCTPSARTRKIGTLRSYESTEQEKCKLHCIRNICHPLCKTVIYNKCESNKMRSSIMILKVGIS